APRRARARLRGRADRAGGRAPHLVDGLARGARTPRAAGAARAPVRARHRLPRRAGSRPGRVRAGARASALGVGEPTFFAEPADFRAWLEENHERASELWVGFHKKATGRPSITWPEAVDEALCFGWIDGIRR